jgi:hypothetical protein
MELPSLCNEQVSSHKSGNRKKAATASVVVELMGESMTATMHKHQCQACGTIWQHADAVAAWLDDEEMEEAHKCPNCDQVRNHLYAGKKLPQFEQQLGIKTVRVPRRTRKGKQ